MGRSWWFSDASDGRPGCYTLHGLQEVCGPPISSWASRLPFPGLPGRAHSGRQAQALYRAEGGVRGRVLFQPWMPPCGGGQRVRHPEEDVREPGLLIRGQAPDLHHHPCWSRER